MSDPEIRESDISTRTYKFWCASHRLNEYEIAVLSKIIPCIEQTIARYENDGLPLNDFPVWVTLASSYNISIDYVLIGEPVGTAEERRRNTSLLIRQLKRARAIPPTPRPTDSMAEYTTRTNPSLTEMGELLGRVIDVIKRLANKLVRK